MSTYDTFVDPVTGDEFQSKAFGKGMRTYRTGDEVTPRRAPLTEAEHAEFAAGRWDPAVPSLDSTSLQAHIAHTDDGDDRYIDVAEGFYTGISTTRVPGVPLVDHFGRLVSPAEANR